MTNLPKRHHFVPQMLQRRFAGDDGRLFFADSRNRAAGALAASPANLLAETHLYTRTRPDGSRDVTLENRYSRLESAISPLLDEITSLVLKGITPIIDARTKRWLCVFIYEQWRRVPDMHNRIMPPKETEAKLHEAIDDYETRFGKLPPEKRAEQLTPEAVAEFRQNARVTALMRSSKRIVDVLNAKGIFFGYCRPRTSFILGSSPVVKIAVKSNQLDHELTEVWLPIHPNIVVAAAGRNGHSGIKEISNRRVREFNIVVARKSSAIVGRSEALINSLKKYVAAGPPDFG